MAPTNFIRQIEMSQKKPQVAHNIGTHKHTELYAHSNNHNTTIAATSNDNKIPFREKSNMIHQLVAETSAIQ